MKSGSYRLTARVSGDVVIFKPDDWLRRPDGYAMVGFRVPLGAPDANKIRGQVTAPHCESFTFRR